MKRSNNVFLPSKFMFHVKFLEHLLAYPSNKSIAIKPVPKIELKKFINFDLDCLGWYAIGHYNSQDFLRSLSEKGVNVKPHSEKYHLASVQRIWASIDSETGIEEIHETSEGAIPITLVELFYD